MAWRLFAEVMPRSDDMGPLATLGTVAEARLSLEIRGRPGSCYMKRA